VSAIAASSERGRTFRPRLLDHAQRRGGVSALVTSATAVSYAELAPRAHAWAVALHALGVGPGAVVGLTMRDEIDHLLATLALFELGVPVVALASREPTAARSRLARRVGVTLVVGDGPEDAVEGVPRLDVVRVLAGASAASGDARLPDAEPARPALFLTGSGTTGEPKIIGFTQDDLARHAEVHLDFAAERVLRPAHVEYNNSKRMRLYTLWQGGTCILANGEGGSLIALCRRHRASWLELSPLHGADLLAAARSDGPLPDDTRLRIGGARVPIAMRRAILAEATPRLHVSYGTTETSLVSCAGPAMHDARETVGPVVRGVTISIVRPDGTEAAPDEIGEIRLRAPGMATAYVNDPVATKRHFRDGWFVPGDFASLDRQGRLAIHGRADDMMILNGINIFPVEIERVLESHPAVAAAAAFPLASPVHGQIPMAVVELRDGPGCAPAELLAWVRGELGVRAPRRVEVVPALPRNAQGKVAKRELAQRFAGTGRP
jgi:acyl-CoA synthetase (AMP-forming)/AMP-acid ligase II